MYVNHKLSSNSNNALIFPLKKMHTGHTDRYQQVTNEISNRHNFIKTNESKPDEICTSRRDTDASL